MPTIHLPGATYAYASKPADPVGPDGSVTRGAVVVLALWLAAAAAAGASGALAGAPAGTVGTLIVSLVGAFGLGLALSRRLRAWALGLDPARLVRAHVLRLFGAGFLVAYARGDLPAAFALPAGWGDVTVALTAPLAARFAPWRTASGWRRIATWQAFALADILVAVGTGLAQGRADAAGMAGITRFPLSLVPTFFVPLALMTHVVLGLQLLARRPAGVRPPDVVGPVAAGVGTAWLLVAAVLGLAGATDVARGPVAIAAIWGSLLALVAAYALVPAVRQWALALDPRLLILFHLTRFVGIPFLVLHAAGRLPSAFAVPAGWGDIVVAAGALAAAAAAPWRTPARRAVDLAWNVVGLADILVVVAVGIRLRLIDPASMAALWTWPLSLVPTFVVPLVIATHLLLFARLRAPQRGAPGRDGVPGTL